MIWATKEPEPEYIEGRKLLPRSARNRVPKGARRLSPRPTPVTLLPGVVPRRVLADGLLEEQVHPVQLEEVERIAGAQHGQLGEAHARGRHAVDAVLVEEPELVHAEPVQVPAPVVGGVQMDLVQAEEEVLREAGAVLLVRLLLGIELLARAPGLPGAAPIGERAAAQGVALPLVFVGQAEPVGDRAVGDGEPGRREIVRRVVVVAELVAGGELLEVGELPAQVDAGRERVIA